MGTKRSTKARAKKMVTVTIDARALRALSGALHKLSELANAFDMGCDEPTVRAELLAKKPRGKRSG